MGLVYAVFLAIVLVKIGNIYAKPSLITLDKYVNFGIKPGFMAQIQPNERVCLLSRHIGEDIQNAPTAALKYVFLYSSYFHPELDFDYSVQSALDPKACGDRTIIPRNLKQ